VHACTHSAPRRTRLMNMSRMYCLLNVLCMPCSCRNVQGHGGGVPAEMFKEDSKSDTLSAMDQDFDRLRGDVEFDATGRRAVDRGSFGAYVDSNVEFHDEELTNDSLETKDPLMAHPVLQRVRDRFMQRVDPQLVPRFVNGTPIEDISDFQRHFETVQKYLFFKQVNLNLSRCALEYASLSEAGDLQYNWSQFMLDSPDECVGIRSGLLETVCSDASHQ